MHNKEVLLIRIGVAVGKVAQNHHLTAAELFSYLKQVFPALDDAVLKGAAAIGAAPLSPG